MGYGSFTPPTKVKKPSSIFYDSKGKPLGLEGFYKDQSIFLICNGPSIGDMNLVPLDYRQTFGINNGGVLRPKFWTAQDPAIKFLDAIWLDPTITKIVPMPRANASFWHNGQTIGPIKDICPSVMYHHKTSDCDLNTWLDASNICWGVPKGDGHRLNSMIAALHIIWFLGFRTVYIIGADFNMTQEQSYFFDEVGGVNGNNELYRLTNTYLAELDTRWQARGYNVFNCTDGGNLTSLRRMSYTNALAESEVLSTRETKGMYKGKGSKGILYYSHNILDGTKINNTCRESLINSGLPITSVTHKPIDLGTNIVVDLPKTLGSMLEQIIVGLENMTEDYVYLAEHDCVYDLSHFNIKSLTITYNTNMWRLTPLGYWKHPDTKPVLSACTGPRLLILEAIKDKLAQYKKREHLFKKHKYVKMLYEPGRGGGKSGKDTKCLLVASENPCLDVRHSANSTTRGWTRNWKYIEDLEPWGSAISQRKELGI